MRDRRMIANALINEIWTATNTKFTIKTIYRRINKETVYVRKPIICIPLNVSRRSARLNWYREHKPQVRAEWASTVFTEQSRFSVNNDQRIQILRVPGIRYYPCNVMGVDCYGGGKVIVWDGVMKDGYTDMHVRITPRLIWCMYLKPYVRVFRGPVLPRFIFKDENNRPHRSELVEEYLEENILRGWSGSQISDLNDIDHV